MRFIHTSDWHLGQYFYGKSRASEHQKFLSWLIDQVKAQQVDAIIVAGDIFDTSTPPSYAREMYFSFIAQIQLLDCQLIILAGNHDSVAMLSESKSLLASLSTRVITHVSLMANEDGEDNKESSEQGNENRISEDVFPLTDKKGKALAVICAIPFIRPRDVIKSQAGQSATDKQKSLQQAITTHYQQLYDQAKQLADSLKKEQGNTLPIIATGHLTALGVSMTDVNNESVRDIYIGTLEAFPSNAFPPADYIALGHIHRAQKVGKTEHIRYCGSPIALSFDEAKQDKKVLLVNFEQGQLDNVIELMVPCFQPLVMVKTSLENLTADIEQVANDLTEKLKPEQQVWLDIEIENSSHLSDLSQRVSDLVTDLPLEVLLVRRSKKARQLMQKSSKATNSTLSELSLTDVFDSRLSELEWKSEEEIARKQRLTLLFNETVEQIKHEDKNS